MAFLTLNGQTVQTSGELPKIGEKAKDFTLIQSNLKPISLSDFKGKRIIMNVHPSIDTSTCAKSVKRFNDIAAGLENTTLLSISSDLPFAQNRFCMAENLNNIITLSDYATSNFGKDYGLEIISGPLFNLHSRAVIVIDSSGHIAYTQQVLEISDEPDYDSVLKALENIA